MKTIKKITVDGKYLEQRDQFELFSYSEFYKLLDFSIEIEGSCGINGCIGGNICLVGHGYSEKLCIWVEAEVSRSTISPDSEYGRRKLIVLHDGDDIKDFTEVNCFLFHLKTLFYRGVAYHIYEIVEKKLGEF